MTGTYIGKAFDLYDVKQKEKNYLYKYSFLSFYSTFAA